MRHSLILPTAAAVIALAALGTSSARSAPPPIPGCDEITQAIAWSQHPGSHDYGPVAAYFTLHNGLKSSEPINSTAADQVWYATGGVSAVSLPLPHLAGTLDVSTNTGNPAAITPNAKLKLKVELYPDGTLRYQRLLDNQPVGGMPMTTVSATCVDDDLLTAIDGGQVLTAGVARQPAKDVPN